MITPVADFVLSCHYLEVSSAILDHNSRIMIAFVKLAVADRKPMIASNIISKFMSYKL